VAPTMVQLMTALRRPTGTTVSLVWSSTWLMPLMSNEKQRKQRLFKERPVLMATLPFFF